MEPKKPMLADDAPEDLRFPLFASPKVDGVRCTVWPTGPLSRSLKPIPNKFVRETIAAARLPAVFDGELVVGPSNAPDVMQRTVSGVMSHDGEPEFKLLVFDYVPLTNDPVERFAARLQRLRERTGAVRQFHPWFELLPQALIHNADQLAEFESVVLARGFEGVITRCPNAAYKHGRSTKREQGMLKVKRFVDTELEVVGVLEQMHNANELQRDERGYAKRSSAQDGLVPAGVLGALVCRWQGTTVDVGTGFTAEQRQLLWAQRDTLVGRLAKVKYFDHGMVDKPRHPVFLGFRDPSDM